AGAIRLRVDSGSVSLGAESVVDVAAAGLGEAGSIEISAPLGSMALSGVLRGTGGGSFALDIGSLPNLDALSPVLTEGGFSRSQTVRVRTGDVSVGGVFAAE